MRERDRKAVQEAVDKTVAQLGDAAPSQITVQAFISQPAPQLIEASKTATFSSLVPAHRGSPSCC